MEDHARAVLHQHPDEARLVARAKAREPEALAALVTRYGPLLRASAAGAVDGDDLYQEAALALIELVQRYEADLGVAFGTFLERHLRWRVANRRRDRRRALERTVPLADHLLIAMEEGTVEAAVMPAGFAGLGLAEAVAGLRPLARVIFVRYYLAGDSIPEIARRTGIGERAARRLVQRIEARIRRELAE